MTWVYLPAILLLLLYGLSWFVLGIALEADHDDGLLLVVLAWAACQVAFGGSIYLALVEVQAV